MTTPILLQHVAFDKTLETTFPFNSIGGNQVVKNRLQILDNVTLAIVYDATQITYSLYHTLPANTLTNGTYYIARVKTYDIANVESEWSNDIQFYCLTTPSVTFQGLTPTINTSNKLFEVLYTQTQSEPISQYQFKLYDSSLAIVQQSPVIYNSANTLPPMTLSYLFEGLLDSTTYYIQLVGTTLHGMSLDTDKESFIVQYTEPDIFSTIEIVSDCENGINTITSNIIAVEGVSSPTEAIYIDDIALDNRDDRVTVTWDNGFGINDVMTIEMWGKQFNPSTEIMRTFGEDANEKVVIKYMNDILDESPTVGEFDALNITSGTFDSKNFTPVKFEYKFNQTLGTQTYNEYIQLTYTDINGVDTVVNSNQIPQTLDDDNAFIFIRYNGTSWTVSIENLKDFWQEDVYGLEVDMTTSTFTRLAGSVGKTAGADFDVANLYGGRRRCNVTDDGVVLRYFGESGYTESGLTTQNIYIGVMQFLAGTPVQVMVEQSKFYYKVVPLLIEPIEFKEINTITITHIPTASGNLTVTLDGVPYTIPILLSDNTTTLVATKIRASAYTGWATSGSGASVIFTSTTVGTRATAIFNGGTTGVTATVVKTQAGYIGQGYHLRKARYYVSDIPREGMKLHPAFISNNIEKDYIYHSAFEGSLFDQSALAYLLADEQVADFNADKLCSIANAKPCSGLTQLLTRGNARKAAQNRGLGWELDYTIAESVNQLLLLIEYATFNSQSAIGLGVVNKAGDGATNMSVLTGQTSSLGNASGMASGTNGLVSISYRGVENGWGNIWKMIDGSNVYAYGVHDLYIADNGFTDNIGTAPYKNVGFTLAKANGYISAFGYSNSCDYLFMPSETLGISSNPVGDYFYQNNAYSGWLIAQLGGAWNSSATGGGFCWHVINTSSNRARSVGGRLVYVPQ